MNIKAALLEDAVQNRNRALSVADYASSDKKYFKELMQCFLSNDYRLAQRAAWSVSWAAINKPAMIQPYIKDLVAQLTRTDVHDAVIRNSARVLQDISIPEKYHGVLMNACFALIEKHETPAAIKAFSLTILYTLSERYPEIKAELQLIINERWPHETAAFRSRGGKILKNLNNKKDN